MRKNFLILILLLILCAPTYAKDVLWTDDNLKEVNLEFLDPLIRDIKILLKGRGFDPGMIDGQKTEEFSAAIKEFEKSLELEETGEPTFELYQKLLRADGVEILKRSEFKTKDGCSVSFRYSEESKVLVIKEKCKTETGLSPIEDDGMVDVPGLANDYIPVPFGQ